MSIREKIAECFETASKAYFLTFACDAEKTILVGSLTALMQLGDKFEK